jgi:hypothetical protein
MIEGAVVVPDGETLTIEEGAKLEFRGPFGMIVNGRVNAQGSEDAEIVLTHSNPAVWWDGLDYPDTPETNDSSFFDHCLFQYGYAQGEEPYNSGGAVVVKNFSNLKFTRCTFQYNKADQQGVNYNPTGGAMALWNSDPIIQNCIFRYNHSDTAAGALFAYEYSDPIISGCLFYENSSSFWAGAVGFYQNSGGVLLNSTIADNLADFGGAVGFYDNASPEVINTILWDNSALVEGNQVYINTTNSTPGFYYCDIEGGKEGFGGMPFAGDYLFNIKEDPLFHMGDTIYGILDDSPCYNSGTPDSSSWFYPQLLPATCLCGNPRISYGTIDKGCYEYFIKGIDNSEINNSFSINIFPNPAISDPVIEFMMEKDAPVSLSIFDLQGKVVYEKQTLVMHRGSNRIALNICNLANGVYFCRILVGNQVALRKLIVQ